MAKAWFRRGEAQLALNDCESARADFDKCLQLEPDNKVSQWKMEREDKNKKMFLTVPPAGRQEQGLHLPAPPEGSEGEREENIRQHV